MISTRFLGESALCVDVFADDPFAANAVVLVVADALRTAMLPGVRDIVPGLTTVTIHLDPVRTDVRDLETLVESAAGAPGPRAEHRHPAHRRHEVPVQYGGTGGPDLESVARSLGMAAADVVHLHADAECRVCFLGFLPGFAYVGPVHESLRIERRATPRLRVPAGSVAIADGFTGIYPADSPGGWHIIGRTDWPLFDVTSPSPARFAPGDLVRFRAW